MGWRKDFANFDLGRLTLVGWLVLVLSVGAGLGAAIVVGSNWDAMFPPQPKAGARRTGPSGYAGAIGAVGFFFAAKVLLNLAGVSMMRPNPGQMRPNPGQSRQEEPVKSKGSPLNYRPLQIVIGLLLLALAFVMVLGSTYAEKGKSPLFAQLAAIVAGLLGFAAVFSWGRPYTTRVAVGVLSLAMIGMAISILLSNNPEIGPAGFAWLIALASGAYAITGTIQVAKASNQVDQDEI